MTKQVKIILTGVSILILTVIFNPFGKNDYGYRQVVENPLSGSTWVQFDQGIYFKGFASKTTTYPNVLTVIYAKESNEPDERVSSLNTPVEIRFSDAAKATSEATVKWRLSDNQEKMWNHKNYYSTIFF